MRKLSDRRFRWELPGLLTLLLVGAAAGCNQDEVLTPTRYLERPNAIDFFCVGPVVDEANQDYTALPPYACDEDIEGASRRAIFGIVTNSARSEVAMVNVTTGNLVDLANENPGFGFVPVGEMPVGVKLTEDGCAGYVTNHGSCDISLVNVNAVLHSAGFSILEDGLHGTPTGRIGIRSASGRLLVRPGDLVLKPEWLDELPPVAACGPIRGHHAYVSLPSCGLVAEVDLDSGRILQSLRLMDNGAVQNAGVDPSCPADCVDFVGDGVSGGPLSDHRPGPLLVTWDGQRLVIGWSTAPQVTFVDIDPDTGAFAHPRTVTLAEEERGVLRIRETLTWTHDWHFLYVITRSGVAHVLDGDYEEECETNPDPADPFFPQDNSDPAAWEAWEGQKGCLRLSAPDTPERAPGVDTPAIEPPGKRKAVDVAFIELDADRYEDGDLTTLDPRYLVGTFAYLVTQDGVSYLINVDEDYSDTLDPGTTETPINWRRGDGVYAILSHQFRDALNTLPDEDGRPRPTDDESQLLYQESEALVDDGTHDRIREVPGGAEPDVSVVDPLRARSETWTLQYMGIIPGTSRTSGQVVRHDLSTVGDDQIEFRDPGLPLCQAGVRDGDVIEFTGCQADKDCADGFYCYRSFLQPAGVAGICLPDDAGPQLEQTCEPLALSVREYTVVRAEADRLVLEVRQSTDATQCTGEGLDGYCCEPSEGDNPQEGAGSPVGVYADGRCLDGPLPDLPQFILFEDGSARTAHCLEGLRHYRIHVGQAQYLISGSRSGTPVGGVPDPDDGDHCIRDPERSSSIRARVPRSEEPFRNQALRFTLELADDPPTYGYYVQFGIEAGFEYTAIDLAARLPASIVLAPDGYMYVTDEGDDNTVGGLQGQVLRLLPGDIALDTSFVVR